MKHQWEWPRARFSMALKKKNQFKKKLKFLKREDLQRSCPLKTLQGAFNLLVAKNVLVNNH